MSLSFILKGNGGPVDGKLVYVNDEYAFRFSSPTKPDAISSVQVNSLQMSISEDGTVLYAHGYCPLFNYHETDLIPPSARPNISLVVRSDNEFIPGVAYSLGGPTDWEVSINKRSGWICLGNPACQGLDAVEFAKESIAVVVNSTLVAIWLHPESLPML
jgi:hypothetical protein